MCGDGISSMVFLRLFELVGLVGKKGLGVWAIGGFLLWLGFGV